MNNTVPKQIITHITLTDSRKYVIWCESESTASQF